MSADADPEETQRVSLGSLLLVAALAIALRLFGLETQSLWFDEILTLNMSQTPYAELAEALRSGESSKPPLYFILQHEWLKFGTSDAWLRLPSAVAGVAACVVAVLVGTELFGARNGWWAGLILAVAPLHVWYSQEARMYALLTLVGFTALLFHLRYLRSHRWLDLLGYALFALLTCYTFTYGIFLPGLCVLLTFLYRPTLPRAAMVRVILASGAVLLGFAPWALRIAAAAAAGQGFQVFSKGPVYEAAGYTVFTLGFGTSLGPSTVALRMYKTAIFSAQPAAAGLMILGFLLVGVVVLLGAAQLWQRQRNAFWFATLGGLAFWGAPAVLTLLKPQIAYNPRYAILALLPMAVFIIGFAAPGRWRTERLVLLGFFGCCVAISLGNHFFNPAYGREDTRGAARIVAALQPPAERVVFCPHYVELVYRHYQLSPAPVFLLDLTSTEAPERLEKLRQEVAPLQRWTLIYGRKEYGDPQQLLLPWLADNFAVQDRQNLTGLEIITIGPKAGTPVP